ncbi:MULTISPECIES: hypothetical protein [unclassified Microcoleus]|uniref:hypothetical protein n=1 Tax=unclassified Microcoleus TaxID=2642155 RepID=UPI0025D1EFFB|nr:MULTISPECIES: hypothetical protein [unclassified Microcoleus]
MKIAIATLIVGVGCGGLSLFGYFDAHASYCDGITNPCTPVVVSGTRYPKTAKFVKEHRGTGLVRVLAGAAAAASFGAGYFASSAGAQRSRKIDELAAAEEARQKQLEATTSDILDEEEIQKTAIASDLRVKDFKRELYDGYNTLYLEKNPELLEALTAAESKPVAESMPVAGALPVAESNPSEIESKSKDETQASQNSNQLLGVELPITPNDGVKFFDWKQFRDSPGMFPHIRGVAPTNGGKTTLFDWLMDVMPSQRKTVITIKRKPHQWTGLEVIGVPENYNAIRKTLETLQSERIRRTALMAEGIGSPMWNVGIDEWRAISKNIKAIVDRKIKQIVSPSAKQIMGDMITLARETNIRIFALAQGRQVVTWGLEDESDLAECFCSIYMGKFAVEECESYRNKYPKDSEQYAKYQQVRDYLESLGNRAAWISCELGEFPAIVPDLSEWKRELPKPPSQTETSVNAETVQTTELATPQEIEESQKLWELAKKRLIESWNEDLNAGEVTAPDDTFTSSPNEAEKVTGEAGEVLPYLDSSTTSLLPEAERSKALTRVMALLSNRGSSEVERVSEVIALLNAQPDKALWLGLKILKLGVTATSRDVFCCGTGGKAFGKAKHWYDLLESTFGKILE